MPSKKPNDKGAASRRPPAPEASGVPEAAGRKPREPMENPATRLKVTLTRSLIGLKPNHVRTLQALGLRKIRATVRHADTPAVRGMLARVPYAVRVEAEREA